MVLNLTYLCRILRSENGDIPRHEMSVKNARIPLANSLGLVSDGALLVYTMCAEKRPDRNSPTTSGHLCHGGRHDDEPICNPGSARRHALFQSSRGGDVLLWQYLFWFFGHPEVYIIFIPALGMVSSVVQTFSRRPVFGYTAMVLSLIATGFIGFGLWVHHMFATGLPQLGLSFFTAASMMIAIPSGVQILSLSPCGVRARGPVGAHRGGIGGDGPA